jgi:enoyl-CoA hydratase
LANRVVPVGQALAAAQALAREIAAFPQTCLRSDRASAMAQWGLDQDAALAQEFAKGLATLGSQEGTAGAARFSAGAGRHGTFGP